ncbi:MAG: DNA glycosylase AlkZ-like family protein [Gaiellaceae bacterium]
MFRTTLHVVDAADFPDAASSFAESIRGRVRAEDVAAVAAAIPGGAVTSAELGEIASRALGTDDEWRVSFALRPIPFVRADPLGKWPHTKPSRVRLWHEPLPEAQAASNRVVRAYLAAYGPATREDIRQFTGFKLRQIDPALDGLRTYADEQGRTLYDARRAPLASANEPAPVRFLPAFDSIILAHADRGRILPDDYRDTVINKKNATTANTFTVDGLVAGAWKIAKARGRWKLSVESFGPLPARVRRELDAEGERLVAFYEA